MFTGIIEEMGTVKNMRKLSDQAIEMTIDAVKVLEDVKIGDSISVNGICLTVTQFTRRSFQVDVMPESLKSTSLKLLKEGSQVNLERSMPANGRFGGHFVTGHIDDIGTIITKQKKENAIYYTIEVPINYTKFLLEKGSIAVDGISLTIFECKKNIFTISLIPQTVSETILGKKREEDIVNIEFDMLGKYVYQMFSEQFNDQKTKVNQPFLKSNGFI